MKQLGKFTKLHLTRIKKADVRDSPVVLRYSPERKSFAALAVSCSAFHFLPF